MKRKLVIAAVVTSLVIGGGAAVAFAEPNTKPDAKVSAETRVVSAAGTNALVTSARPASVAEAIAAALKHTPGTAVGADREDDGADAGTWHVDVVKADGTEHTVAVSPDTGTVVGAHRDADDEGDDAADGRADLAALKGAGVDAREAALAVAAKGTVTDVDLDDDGGATTWSVDTAKGGEWQVDAHTGKVTQDLDD
ncbi:Peptidase propeptide and YPEB domain-containing protein [Streptomyces sp. yr375]|uniref:PepSY domain-containing protein n=1 Tax=Streptomyces sp. yr375 TaxID=1761906 RepID=UPI0008AE714C|nr:PepSY domain-containing protein [Streptomyces sp. yr375]SER31747.1 Peptidase propeptide and YPEB domain-containing protein [Streptomyces sp. yr375]